jgi:phage shock protein A
MLKRLYNMFRGLLGLSVSKLEMNNPEALLENEKENLRAQTAKFNNALANHAGEVERLSALSKKLNVEEEDLRKKVKALLAAGNRELAATIALKLQAVDKRGDEILAQLNECETQYKELTKARDIAVKGAAKKIEELSVGITDLKIKQAAAELSEMATGMISSIGSSGDSLNRISGMVEEARNKAAGRARVAGDSVDVSAYQAEEDLDKAMAAAALADLEAEMGIASPKAELSEADRAALLGKSMTPA